MEAARSAASLRDENDRLTGSSSGSGVLEHFFAEVLREISRQKSQGSSRAASGPPAFELQADCCDEYDTHLRRPKHQHALESVAILMRLKANETKYASGSPDATVMQVLCPALKADPRFLPRGLLLHRSLWIQPFGFRCCFL